VPGGQGGGYQVGGGARGQARGASEGPHVTTPLLYVRGEQERGGGINNYAEGLRGAGVVHVEQGIVSGAGHFTQEETPEETWRLIADFAQL
jgi:pimeloyl-ACP methyl ester carboxylesterase